MTSSFLQIGRFLVSLTITGLLAGCGALGGGMAMSALSAGLGGAALGGAIPRKPKPPEVHCVAEDSMAISYGTKGSSVARDEAMQLIAEHCDHGHVETHRAYHTLTAKVYISCLRADGVTPESPSCKYIAPKKTPIGFGNYDPAVDES